MSSANYLSHEGAYIASTNNTTGTAEGLKKATKKIKKIRLRRAITNALPLPIQFIEDVTESAIRKTRRVLNKKERRGCDI